MITCNWGWHLKAVEFQVTEDAVIILVGNVKYPAEGSNTQRFELGGNNTGQQHYYTCCTFIGKHVNVQQNK